MPDESTQGPARTIVVLVVVALVAVIASFIAPRFIAPTGDGFTRGLNRLPLFFGLQLLGFLAGLTSAVITANNKARLSSTMRRLGYVPLGIFGLEMLALVLLIAYSAYSGGAQ